MPPKKEFSKEINTEEELENLLNKENEKLVFIDLYSNWAGPCVIFKDYYKILNNTIDDLPRKMDIVTINQSKFKMFESYNNLGSKPKFLFYLNGKLIKEVDGPNSVICNEIIEKNIPKD